MIFLEIIAILFAGIFIIILCKSIVKYRFYKLTDDKILFRRFSIYKSTLSLGKETIKEIYYCTLMDKSIGYVVVTVDNKEYNISYKLDLIKMKRFVMRNKLKFLKDEAYHGGGVSKIYSPPLKNNNVE